MKLIMEAIGHNEDVPAEVLAARKTYQEYYRGFKKETDAEHERVIALGGLHIIGTERHESRRIDNQLRGPLRPPGRSRLLAVLYFPGGRGYASVRLGAHHLDSRAPGPQGRRTAGSGHSDQAD